MVRQSITRVYDPNQYWFALLRLSSINSDLVPDEKDLARIENRLRAINTFAPILRTTRSAISVDAVLNLKAFDLQKTLERDAEFLDTEAEHVHDETISSLGIRSSGDVDLSAFEDYLGGLLRDKVRKYIAPSAGAPVHPLGLAASSIDCLTFLYLSSFLLAWQLFHQGNDLYRIKGVIAVEGEPRRFVYQAVHMIFNGDFTDPWADDEERGCKLTFIGKNLDKTALQEGFDETLATEENKAKRAAKLRFKIGDEVECNLGFNKWKTGKVISLFFRDESMPPGMTAPYQVQLDEGDIIFAPADKEELIRNKYLEESRAAKKAKVDDDNTTPAADSAA